ncbi:MAG TPA: MBL fold metallo-hydrolase [Terriglobales bacterium]|nr:MBL fold metallo-hydrolase [Terriglobales bacterium]
MRLTVLASGSRGNCTVVSNSSTSLLVDAGLSCRETLKRMAETGEDPSALSAIVITHEHQDHVNGLAVLARKLKIPVFMTGATHQAWKRWSRKVQFKDEPEKASLERLQHFEAGKKFAIGSIDVTPFTISHDAVDPVGFVFTIEGIRIGFVTDIGQMLTNVSNHLRTCDGLLIESNHDLEMLRNGPYPWSVKQRVMSRVGHLSNDALAKFLSEDYDGGAAFLVLAHLSENNNHPEVARRCAETVLEKRRNLLHSNTLHLAMQDQPLPAIKL